MQTSYQDQIEKSISAAYDSVSLINELNSNHSANTNSQENILEIISYKEFQNEEYIIYKIQINVENF